MSQAAKFVTRTEFEVLTERVDKLTTKVEVLTIRVEVLSNDMHHLTHAVADLAERMNAGFEETEKRFDKLENTVEQGFATLMSAILNLAPR